MGHHSICMTSGGVFLKIKSVIIRTVPQTAEKGGFVRLKKAKYQFFCKFRMASLKYNFQNDKMLTGSLATAL